MIKKCIAYIGLLVVMSNCGTSGKQEDVKNPNVIIIMADDLGYNDLSCYGSATQQTPNIDKLAENGVRFTDYHSNGAVCSPTRAALLTGRYQQRSGIGAVVTALNHRHTGLAEEETTLADFFKNQNYRTGIVGKWHLGYDTLFSPTNNGFDYFKGFVSGNIDYHSHIDQTGHYDWWLNKETIKEKGYSTDLITESSIEFIEESDKEPFFLYIAHESPHYPYQGRSDKADRTVNGKFKVQGSREDRGEAYKEMISAMDEGVGNLIEYLENNHLLNNTLILFISDNGATGVGSNAPLNGHKGSMWEGGHRVPAIAYWKGKTVAGVSNETIISMDLFPTLVELINPGYSKDVSLDGSSIMSEILPDDKYNTIPIRSLFWRYKDRKAVRLDDWKLMVDNSEHLFNLKDDIGEKDNLAMEHPEKRDSLLTLLNKWESEMSKYPPRTN